MTADLGPLLAAVTDEWERGKIIAKRAGIDSRTAGPRLMSLVREGMVAKSWTDKHGGVSLYRRGPKAPPVKPVAPAWEQALTGLRCIAFVRLDAAPTNDLLPRPGEITGVSGEYVYVVLDGEEEPRRVYWTGVRPRSA